MHGYQQGFYTLALALLAVPTRCPVTPPSCGEECFIPAGEYTLQLELESAEGHCYEPFADEIEHNGVTISVAPSTPCGDVAQTVPIPAGLPTCAESADVLVTGDQTGIVEGTATVHVECATDPVTICTEQFDLIAADLVWADDSPADSDHAPVDGPAPDGTEPPGSINPTEA